MKRFPDGEGKWQMSAGGGHWPRWSRGADKLWYMKGNDLLEVDVRTWPALSPGTPRRLFTREPIGADMPFSWPEGFDVAPDGQRFALVQNAEQRGSFGGAGVTVVQNWFAESREKR